MGVLPHSHRYRQLHRPGDRSPVNTGETIAPEAHSILHNTPSAPISHASRGGMPQPTGGYLPALLRRCFPAPRSATATPVQFRTDAYVAVKLDPT